MFDGRLGSRVAKLENNLTALSDDVKEVRDAMTGLGGKIDSLAAGLSSTGERAAQRAYAVRDEMRAENDRKGKEKTELLKNGLALMGGVGLIVTALVGPYRERLDSTAQGQQADTVAIAGVREVLAQQGAGIGRNQASIDIMRESNHGRDDLIRGLDQRMAHLEGRLDMPGSR